MADIRVLNSEVDAHAVPLTDGDEIFFVPRRYAAKICAAIPELRHSFEHLGGRHLGHVSQFSETVRHAEQKEHDANPEPTAETAESVEKEDDARRE